MKSRGFVSPSWIVVFGLLTISCLLPGMIPLNRESEVPLPPMETDADRMLETLRGDGWVYLQALAEEEYSEAEYSKPGTFTYTVHITEDRPTYFNYGWCATTQEILQQNFEHIRLRLSFEGQELSNDVVHPLTLTRPDGFVCLDFGTLILEWSPGEYELEAVATFDEPINDGDADFEAGDYIYHYNVTVEE